MSGGKAVVNQVNLVAGDIDATIAFYERLGYRQLGRVDGYYQGRESAVRMGRDLGVVDHLDIAILDGALSWLH